MASSAIIFTTLIIISDATAFRPSAAPFSRQSRLLSSDFDFSSKQGWDDFYEDKESKSYEWHASVPHSSISSIVSPMKSDDQLLVLGCGTSSLSADLYDTLKPRKLTSLDYSLACITEMNNRYEDADRENLHFIQGDAKSLNEHFHLNQFTSIVDKGLIDAIMTSDDWDSSIAKILKGASSFLAPGGSYVLVSYNLSKSTKKYLNELKYFHFTYDLEGSNDRVSISKGIKTTK